MQTLRARAVAIGMSTALGVAFLPAMATPAVALPGCPAYYAAHAGGTGVTADPYRVDSAEALDFVRHCADKAFLQTADIDLSAYSPWSPILGSEQTGWFGVGTFVGTYDGGGHTITGLTVREGIPDPDFPDEDYGVGLFAAVEQGGVSNLTVAGATIAYDHTDRSVLGVGILAGAVGNGARISNVTVGGSVSVRAESAFLVGGLTGGFGETSVDTASTMDRATSTADVSVWSPVTNPSATTSVAVGGLVGAIGYIEFRDFGVRAGSIETASGPTATASDLTATASGPTATRSRASGAVSADSDGARTLFIGGFAGFVGVDAYVYRTPTVADVPFPPVSVSQSSATGAVSGRALVGGFTGLVGSFGTIRDCLARGAVTGSESVAGLAAGLMDGATVRDCYSTGKVTGTTDPGGLIATLSPLTAVTPSAAAPTVTSSYWDVETSGLTAGTCADAALCGAGKPTGEMKTQATFSGWAFGAYGDSTAVWGMCAPPFNDYPFLWAFQATDPCPTVPGAPQNPTAVAGNAQATVQWSPPTSDGGAPIVGYTVTGTPVPTASARADAPACTTTGALTCTLTGLTNGTAYTFAITATNAVGTGPASVATTAVTPSTSQRPLRPLNLPSRLRNPGWTRLVRLPVPTNAGQDARVRVTCRPVLRPLVPSGDVVVCRVVRREGAIRVWLSGAEAARVRVVVSAKAVPGYSAYRKVRVYRTRAVG